jgi:4a-hydroxytetrahydrobiopterin dehydratase
MDIMKKTWIEVDYWPDRREQKALQKDFVFSNFESALEFANKVGALAEKAEHQPDINLGWGYVRVWLTTHSSHSVTKKDHDLAKAIDQIRE